ncbi:MAG TPA: CpsD/CapB family tyrosine-protein kinase, partial [Bryobacteraceae bacterium]
LRAEVVGSLPLMKNARAGQRLSLPGSYHRPGLSEEPDANGFGESVRTLRNSILLANLDRRYRSLLVTSAAPAEGKTTTAANLAAAHAEQGLRTLLIDGDLRRPSVHRNFNIPGVVGLANALLGEFHWRVGVIAIEGLPELHVLPAGAPSRRAADLIGRGLMELIEEASADYDLVVLDGPPLLGFAEPLQMATAVDGVLVVVRAGQTTRKAVATVLATLNRVRAKTIGLVLNEVHKELSDSYGYYGYLAAAPKKEPATRYFHFDSWRVNISGDDWVPAQIYVEEGGSVQDGRPSVPRFKAQTRIWGYTAASTSKVDELTTILIDSSAGVQDEAASKDVSPLESQRLWERQSEENVIARLEKAGLLAPAGPVDQMLDTVLNNLIDSAHLGVEGHCRVLLTTPMETFSIGQTIVISRGLIDVLPDETSLALLLADELAHIALAHRTPTQFAFRNQTMLSDAELLQRIHFERTPAELESAGKKTVEIMRASPYQKTANAGLFLQALTSRSGVLPRLLAANMGNQVANAATLARLAEFTAAAPALEESQLQQIAALPLGSRIKLDPWSDRIVLVKTRPLEILSPREKMPFEITPFMLYLTRSAP